MHVIFETERLIIRRYTRWDEENFFRLNGDPEVMRYIREPKSRSACNVFLLQNIVAYEEAPLMGRWAMLEKASGNFVGSFAVLPVPTRPEIQLGYALLKDYWGKGFAVESTLAGKQYAFDLMKLPQISAVTNTENIASQKVLLKTGFVQQPNIVIEENERCFFTCDNPNVVDTERLLIFPLTYAQLLEYLEASNKLEKLLNLAQTGRSISPSVLESVTQYTLPKMKNASGTDHLFHTFWLVVEKASREIVAELGFKGPPGATGDVEIGYGTMPFQERKGYMTEAVGGILQWATRRTDIVHVVAETHTANTASIRIVQKNGFQQFDKKGDMLWWKAKV